ncbi:MAG: hypothetical protein ABWY25_07435 [Paenisporosarcina sp.]
MELIKLISTTGSTTFTQGTTLPAVDSVMWVERYSEPGEFEITAKLSSGIREALPLGTFISHTDTLELMFVENHEIMENYDQDPTIKITGRSLEAFLESRIIGTSFVRTSRAVQEYTVTADYTWNQLRHLINWHLDPVVQDDGIENVVAISNVTGTGVYEARSYKKANVLSKVLELLSTDNLGIKTLRRSPFGIPDSSSAETRICIHRGTDKSSSVIFSWKAGDIDGAEYLWSDRKTKTSVTVVGRFVNTIVDTVGYTKFNRRMMLLSAEDLDGHLNAFPSEPLVTEITNKMAMRGREALAAQNRITITRTDLADVSKYQYRKDFNLGDIITLDANFGYIAKMRVVEYVEIQDENGESGHPTLEVPWVLP